MYGTFENYGRGPRAGANTVVGAVASTWQYVTQTLGRKASQTLTMAGIAASHNTFAIAFPVLRIPNRRATSILVHPRSSVSTFAGKVYLFGCNGPQQQAASWFGPVDSQAFSSTATGLATKTVVSTPFYCAESLRIDTQDFERAALLLTISATSNNANWAAGRGICLDVHIQHSTA